jgi:WD40-like Beta Propeller Repeat
VGTQIVDGSASIVEIGLDGQIKGPVRGDLKGFEPHCSPDGRVLYYLTLSEPTGIERCEGGVCREIVRGLAGATALSPDGNRLAFFVSKNSGLSYQWIPTDGRGSARQIIETAGGCIPEWSTNEDLWLAVRRGREVIWKEFNVESGRATGRTSPGSHDCSDGLPDPLAPIRDDVAIERRFRTQLRLLPGSARRNR